MTKRDSSISVSVSTSTRPASLTFTAYGTPKGQGNHRRNQYGAVYETTKGHARWRAELISAAGRASQRVALDTITGPVAVRIGLQIQRPASHYHTGQNRGTLRISAPTYPVSRRVGDIDKHARSVLDALTAAHVIADDALVIALTVDQRWCLTGEAPGAVIVVREVQC